MKNIKDFIEDRKGMIIGDNYFVTNDNLNLIVEEYGIKVNPKDKSENFGLKKVTYHRTLEQVLNHILENNIYNCDLSELKSVCLVIEDLRCEIKKFKDITTVDFR
jgi:hypothetical protein